jgi:hypothetical protein
MSDLSSPIANSRTACRGVPDATCRKPPDAEQLTGFREIRGPCDEATARKLACRDATPEFVAINE